MPLHVFDHDDGVVDHQTHRQYDGQQGKQVECETENLHQEYAADQRQGNGHHRNQGRSQGSQEKKDDDHDDEQSFA